MDKFELSIQVEVRQIGSGYGALRIAETVEVAAGGFLELCKILAEFDSLAKRLKFETTGK